MFEDFAKCPQDEGGGRIAHPSENHGLRAMQVRVSSEEVIRRGIFYRGSGWHS